MRRLQSRRPAVFLALCCYAAGLALALLFATGRLVYNRVLYANGTLQPLTLSAEDAALENLEPLGEGRFVATSADPQLHISGHRADTVTLDIEYNAPPEMVQAFWGAPGEAFTLRRMAYAQSDERTLWLSAGGAEALRIDPGIIPGRSFTLRAIYLNQPRPAWAFYRPSPAAANLLLFAPGLLASVLWLAPRRKKGVPA